jgi:hypothetical protein
MLLINSVHENVYRFGVLNLDTILKHRNEATSCFKARIELARVKRGHLDSLVVLEHYDKIIDLVLNLNTPNESFNNFLSVH